MDLLDDAEPLGFADWAIHDLAQDSRNSCSLVITDGQRAVGIVPATDPDM